jgi:hypothetical protein
MLYYNSNLEVDSEASKSRDEQLELLKTRVALVRKSIRHFTTYARYCKYVI